MKAKKNELENRVFVSDVAKDILTPNEPKKSRAAPGASVGPRVKVESLAEVKVDFSVQVQAWADAEAKAEREIGKTQWDLGEQVSKYREDSIPVKRIRERLKEDSTEVFGKQSKTKQNYISEILKVGLTMTVAEIREARKEYTNPHNCLFRNKIPASRKDRDTILFSNTPETNSNQPTSWTNPEVGGEGYCKRIDQERRHAKSILPSKDAVIRDLDLLEAKSPDTFKEIIEEELQESDDFRETVEKFIKENPAMFNLKLAD